MKKAYSRILSLAAFQAWLLTKHPRTKVGTAACEDNCPLAKFITQTTGRPTLVDGESYQMANVDADGKIVKDAYGEIEYGDYVNLPLWAQDFVGHVDENEGSSVSVQRALAITELSSLGRRDRSQHI